MNFEDRREPCQEVKPTIRVGDVIFREKVGQALIVAYADNSGECERCVLVGLNGMVSKRPYVNNATAHKNPSDFWEPGDKVIPREYVKLIAE